MLIHVQDTPMTDAAEASATHTPTNTPSTSAAAAAAPAGSNSSSQPATAAAAKLGASIFVSDDAPVYDMPVSAINRPLLSELDPIKVQQFVDDMRAGAQFTPIEVVRVQDNGKNYYFAFGGCHRWAAVKQLRLPTIRARLIQMEPTAISTFLGASSPFRKQQQQQQHQQQQQQLQQDEATATTAEAAPEAAAAAEALRSVQQLQLA